MNILVTGGYGFIGSNVAERFYKENHRVYIIDSLFSGKKENVEFKHRSFIGDVTDEKCESFFKAHSFEVVIHCAAQASAERSADSPLEDSSVNIQGLVNMLNLSKKYGVKMFVFCSSAEVYSGNLYLPLKEGDLLDPVSPYGINKMTGELYCRKWEEMYGLSSLVLRFSDVYGPRQHGSAESSAVAAYTANFLKEEAITVYGSSRQTHDFIYVGDVAEAVYRGVINRLSGVFNVSTNTQTSINELLTTMNKLKTQSFIEVLESDVEDVVFSQLDNNKLKKELYWRPKISLEEGLKTTLEYYENLPTVVSVAENKASSSLSNNQWMHFLENSALFIMFYSLSLIAVPVVEMTDFWLIYVILAALLFGKTQAVFASFLAISIHVNQAYLSGRELVSLFMDNGLLAIFIMYLLVGLIVSYVVDRYKVESLFTKDELASSQAQYSFLSSVYDETLEIKNELQQQILRSDNGIGQIHQATRLLDSLEPEEILPASIQVLEQILKGKHFALYFISPNGFGRLITKSDDPLFMPEASLKIEENPLINAAVKKQEFMFNHSMVSSDPFFAAPLVQQSNTVAVIVCYDVKFQDLTLSYQNLVTVVTHLINAAFERSSNYIQEINHIRYIEGTIAMKPLYFERVLKQKQKVAETLHIPYTLIRINGEKYTAEKMKMIGSAIRETDYLGFIEEGKLNIILSNTEPREAAPVLDRLKGNNIEANIVEETLAYVG